MIFQNQEEFKDLKRSRFFVITKTISWDGLKSITTIQSLEIAYVIHNILHKIYILQHYH